LRRNLFRQVVEQSNEFTEIDGFQEETVGTDGGSGLAFAVKIAPRSEQHPDLAESWIGADGAANFHPVAAGHGEVAQDDGRPLRADKVETGLAV
jgi:hypothetical protein